MNNVMRDKCWSRRLARSPYGRSFTDAVLVSMSRTTPGAINRTQIMPTKVWRWRYIGTIAAWTAFVLFMAFVVFAWITR